MIMIYIYIYTMFQIINIPYIESKMHINLEQLPIHEFSG